MADYVGRLGGGAQPPANLAVAYYLEDGVTPTTHETQQALRTAAEILRQSGLIVDEARPPGLGGLRDAWNDLWLSAGGARHLLAGYLATAGDGHAQEPAMQLSPSLRRLVDASPTAPNANLEAQALREIDSFAGEMATFFARYALVLCPVAPGPAPIHPGRWTIDGVDVKGAGGFGYCFAWSVLGYPALSVPWATGPEGLPLGLQVVGSPGHDSDILALGKMLEARRLNPAEGCTIPPRIS